MTTELTFVDFKCPYCADPVSFPQDCAGLAQECPSCGESVIVPDDGSEFGRKLPIPLTTPRLVVRRLRGTDWKDLLECRSDVMEESDVLHWLDSDSTVKLTTPGQPFWLGAELQPGGKLVGCLALNFIDAQRVQAALDILVNRNYQRQGFATEALDAILGFCFAGIRLHRVTASCDSENTPGCRLFEKTGLRREAEFRQDRQKNGEWMNTVWFAMLREEFLARKK
jgi:RimJ/RimL family protein N-acetyltransferase